MYLRTLTFRENEGKAIEWLIDDVHLGKINLIVGENSSGKTRTLNAIGELVEMLRGRLNIPKIHGKYKVTFMSGEEEIQLDFEYDNGVILNEAYVIGANRNTTLSFIGIMLFLLTLGGISIHIVARIIFKK